MSGLKKQTCHNPGCTEDEFAALSKEAYAFCVKANTLSAGIEQGKKLCSKCYNRIYNNPNRKFKKAQIGEITGEVSLPQNKKRSLQQSGKKLMIKSKQSLC